MNRSDDSVSVWVLSPKSSSRCGSIRAVCPWGGTYGPTTTGSGGVNQRRRIWFKGKQRTLSLSLSFLFVEFLLLLFYVDSLAEIYIHKGRESPPFWFGKETEKVEYWSNIYCVRKGERGGGRRRDSRTKPEIAPLILFCFFFFFLYISDRGIRIEPRSGLVWNSLRHISLSVSSAVPIHFRQNKTRQKRFPYMYRGEIEAFGPAPQLEDTTGLERSTRVW